MAPSGRLPSLTAEMTGFKNKGGRAKQKLQELTLRQFLQLNFYFKPVAAGNPYLLKVSFFSSTSLPN